MQSHRHRLGTTNSCWRSWKAASQAREHRGHRTRLRSCLHQRRRSTGRRERQAPAVTIEEHFLRVKRLIGRTVTDAELQKDSSGLVHIATRERRPCPNSVARSCRTGDFCAHPRAKKKPLKLYLAKRSPMLDHRSATSRQQARRPRTRQARLDVNASTEPTAAPWPRPDKAGGDRNIAVYDLVCVTSTCRSSSATSTARSSSRCWPPRRHLPRRRTRQARDTIGRPFNKGSGIDLARSLACSA